MRTKSEEMTENELENELESLTIPERAMAQRICKEIRAMSDIMVEAHFGLSRSQFIDDVLPDMGDIEFLARCAKIWNIYLLMEPEFDMVRAVRMRLREEWMDHYYEEWENKYGDQDED